MSRKNRRKFLQGAVLASVAPLAPAAPKSDADATAKKSPPSLPDEISSVVSITGDLRKDPVVVTDLRRGELSGPIELEGNGTYRLAITPVTRGRSGAEFEVVLADAGGARLARTHVGTRSQTLFNQCGIAHFAQYGVMVYIAHV
jgi:hypothetical protein